MSRPNGQPLSGYALALADIEKRGSSAPSGMSLAAARNAGAIGDDEERVASAAKPKKGNVLARLFGFSTDEDEDDDSSAAAPAEPRRRGRRQAGAGSARSAAAGPPGRDRVAASTPSPPAASRSRPPPPRRSRCPSRTVPRPPAEVAEPTDLSASRAETTASITSWLNDAEFARTDRVPPGMALAYAANAAPETASARSRSRRRWAPHAAPAPAATTQVARIPPKAGQRYNDPWMRGITLATSVHYEMNVTVYGRLDVRQVRMMMIKPVASVPMTFGSRSV